MSVTPAYYSAVENHSPSDREVGLEAELAGVGRQYFSVLEAVARDERAVQQRLDEELGIEVRRRRVERSTGDSLAEYTKGASASTARSFVEGRR